MAKRLEKLRAEERRMEADGAAAVEELRELRETRRLEEEELRRVSAGPPSSVFCDRICKLSPCLPSAPPCPPGHSLPFFALGTVTSIALLQSCLSPSSVPLLAARLSPGAESNFVQQVRGDVEVARSHLQGLQAEIRGAESALHEIRLEAEAQRAAAAHREAALAERDALAAAAVQARHPQTPAPSAPRAHLQTLTAVFWTFFFLLGVVARVSQAGETL